jgi:hypothetical protein
VTLATYRGDGRTDNNLTDHRFRSQANADPTNYGWTKPVFGRSVYHLDCGRIVYRMKTAMLWDYKADQYRRCWIVEPLQRETGDIVGEAVVYDIGCDLDAVTDALIDYASNVEALLSLVQLQHYEYKLEMYRAYEAETVTSPPPSVGCPDDSVIPW